MTPRRPMTPARRLRILKAHDYQCCLCPGKIDPVRDVWTVEHLLALGLEGPDDDDNCGPAHEDCRRKRDKDDVSRMAKADRQGAYHFGARTPSRRPMPHGKDSPTKRKVSGEVVLRDG